MESGEGGPHPETGKNPTLPSLFRPISVLPALSKVWEYTFKTLIQRSGPFYILINIDFVECDMHARSDRYKKRF
jgi:hypothetical protein